MARVGVDIDGVLYPFHTALREFLLQHDVGKAEDFPEPTRWDFYLDWGLSEKSFIELCNEGVNDRYIFWEGKPFPGSLIWLSRLKNAGHTIVLITNRFFGDEGMSERATRVWLKRWQIPYHELHFLKDKTQVSPMVDYHLDDNISNHLDMCRAGVDSWLLNTDWNQESGESGGIFTPIHSRMNTLKDYVDYVVDREAVKAADAVSLGYQYQPVRVSAATYKNVKLDRAEFDSALRDEVRVTSSTGGQKGKKLARFSLIPQEALWKVAELYGAGAEKYDDWNWRKGYDWSLSIDALGRHLSRFLQGESIDPETGCHHLAAVVFHSMTLMTFEEEHPDFDDRFKHDSGDSPEQ